MLPREHGAWSLLLTPFFAALLIAAQLNLSVAAALVAVLAAFLIRTPLVVLARQHWTWRDPRPESAQARQWLSWLLLTLFASAAALIFDWGWPAALSIGAGVLALTFAAVWMTVRNRQRTVWFQILSCAGLAFSAVAAARAATGRFPLWAWLLWGLCTLNGAAGVLVVHTRLDALIARKTGVANNRYRLSAWCAVAISALTAVAIAATGRPPLALAPALASAAHAVELHAMNLDTRLTTVGLRAMTLSIIHALLLAAALSATY